MKLNVRAVLVLGLLSALTSLATATQLPAYQTGPDSPRTVVRVGVDHTVGIDEVVREVVLVMGSASIEGRVERDVVVVLGALSLGPSASVGGSVVNVAGRTQVEPGAEVAGDLVVVAGGADLPAGFLAGGEEVVIGTAALGDQMTAVLPWFTRGLLWGRPLVPDLGWVWLAVGGTLFFYLVLSLLFDRPLRTCSRVLSERPLSTSLVGLLVLFLIGPVSFILTVSVVGIAVLPFALSALFIAGVFGRVAVIRWLGSRLMVEGPEETRLEGLRSLGIGSAVLVLAYLIPVLGMVTWMLVGLLGLGAVTLAFVEGLARESPTLEREEVSSSGSLASEPHPASAPQSEYSESPGPQSTEDEDVGSRAQVPPMPDPDRPLFPFAGFAPRFGAFLLDLLLVAVATSLLGITQRPGTFLLWLLAYHIAFWSWKATTVGGIVCRLRIVRSDSEPPNFADALVRGLSSIFSLAAAGIGGLWILVDPQNRTWHDKIAGTYVVRVPRDHPL